MLGLKGHKGQIHDGPISRSLYNDLFNTYTKFYAFIAKCTQLLLNFLLCRPTKPDFEGNQHHHSLIPAIALIIPISNYGVLSIMGMHMQTTVY